MTCWVKKRMSNKLDDALMRREMVSSQIAKRGIKTAAVLDAMLKVPRHEFVPHDLRRNAYGDHPLPIGQNQTISQPYIVALMTDLLHLSGSDRVLEIGTGSGYQAAVLSLLAGEVHTVERHASLAQQAEQNLHSLGYENVFVHLGDGSMGWADNAPYRGILVTAAAPAVPEQLKAQLDDNARLVIPVGTFRSQELLVVTRNKDDYDVESIIPVSFVPLCGHFGWQDGSW